MLASHLRLLTLVSAATALSCQEPPDISSEVAEYKSLVNDINGTACGCPSELGFMTPIECSEVYGTISPDEGQCLDDALVGSEEAANNYLECANNSLRFYLQCLEANSACEGGYDDCRATFDVDISACPALPPDVNSAFEACVTRV